MQILTQAEQWPFRCAAVNQDMVNRLHKEFLDWTKTRDRAAPSYKDWKQYGDPDAGPIAHWRSIEDFLKDRYPASNRSLNFGHEEAGSLLDWDWRHPDESQGMKLYETGPEAEAQYGYDPKEVAATMMLLHNKSQPLREDLVQEDEDRLVDIFNKRQKMQQNYEQRQRVAMRGR